MADVYLEQVLMSFPRPIATLLDSGGDEFPGGNSVNEITMPHERPVEEHHERANLEDSFTQFGAIGWLQSIRVDAYSEACVAAIYSQVGRAATGGTFILERPPLNPNGQGWRHWIRFYYDNISTHFEPVFEVRTSGGIQLHRATIEQIRVLNTERFG